MREYSNKNINKSEFLNVECINQTSPISNFLDENFLLFSISVLCFFCFTVSFKLSKPSDSITPIINDNTVKKEEFDIKTFLEHSKNLSDLKKMQFDEICNLYPFLLYDSFSKINFSGLESLFYSLPTFERLLIFFSNENLISLLLSKGNEETLKFVSFMLNKPFMLEFRNFNVNYENMEIILKSLGESKILSNFYKT